RSGPPANDRRAPRRGVETTHTISPRAEPDRTGAADVRRVDVRRSHSFWSTEGGEERRLETMQSTGVGAKPQASFAVEKFRCYNEPFRKCERISIVAKYLSAGRCPDRPRLGPQRETAAR